MRSTQDLVGLAALMAAVTTVVGQSITASPSLSSNFSLTRSRPETTATPGNFCCYMVAEAVGLNYWWSSTRGPYTATVVTSYIEYDNTVVTELATITQPLNFSASGWLGSIPPDIIATNNEYRATVLANFSTIASYPTTVIAAPTPHLVINNFDLFTGTQTTDEVGSSSCYVEKVQDVTRTQNTLVTAQRFSMPTAYVYVEDPPITRTDRAFLPAPPSDITDSLYSQKPTVTEDWPYVTHCPISSGTGQPTVHIAVTALTSSSSTTVRRAGNAPGGTSSSGGQTTQEPEPPASTTEPAPAPTTAPADPPSTTNQPEAPPATTQAPQDPEPTGPANPPASTAVDPPSPPANTQTPPQNSQAPPENTPVPPANTQEPANPAPTTAGSPAPANPPAPGNTQPPAESGGSAPQPSDAVPPPAGPVAPSNTPSLPFPIVPVPVPTAAPTDNTPPIEDTPPAGETPTNGGNPPTTTSVTPGAVVLPGDQTLNPGQQTTISGVVISVPSPAVPESDATAPPVVVDGTTLPAAQPTAPPLVVVDGTTVTLPTASPTEVTEADQPADQPVVPVTLGTQVLTLEAPSTSGEGIVLPNSETLELGSTTVIDEQTLIATVVTSGTSVATVVEVADESTTQSVTRPTAVPTESESESGDESEETAGATGTGAEAPEFSGAAVKNLGAWGWGVVHALGLAFLGLA